METETKEVDITFQAACHHVEVNVLTSKMASGASEALLPGGKVVNAATREP